MEVSMNNSLTLTVRSTLTGETTQIVLRDGSYDERIQEYYTKLDDPFVYIGFHPEEEDNYFNMGGVYRRNREGGYDKIGYIEVVDIRNLENYITYWNTQSVPEDYPFWCPALWD
jgi:hypothetical protein